MMDSTLILVCILPVDAPLTALTPVAKPAEKKSFQHTAFLGDTPWQRHSRPGLCPLGQLG